MTVKDTYLTVDLDYWNRISELRQKALLATEIRQRYLESKVLKGSQMVKSSTWMISPE